jgi:hypothetical protein
MFDVRHLCSLLRVDHKDYIIYLMLKKKNQKFYDDIYIYMAFSYYNEIKCVVDAY